MNLFRSLSNRSFALLWGGQTTSRLGDSLFSITLAWWILEKTGSAAAMGKMLIFSTIPMLLFLLVGGVVTDRFKSLNVMLIADIASGTIVLIITILAFTGLLQIWQIYVGKIIFGLVAAFFQPAYTAAIPAIVPKEQLPSANSMTNLSQRGAGIFGPAIGAAIVAIGGTSLAFGLNCLSFFISATCILLIILERRKNQSRVLEKPDVLVQPIPSENLQPKWKIAFNDFHEGYKAVVSSSWLWVTILIFGLINATSTPVSVSLPVFTKINLNSGVQTLGFFTSSSAIGFVLGSIVLGNFKKLRKRGLQAYLATVLYGVMIASFGLIRNIPLLIVASFFEGALIALFGLIWTNTLQELVPHYLLGRVASIDSLGSFILLPIGYGISGWATDLIGAPQVFVIGGALTALLALLGLLHPAIRNLD